MKARIIRWIKNEVKKSGTKGIVLGLSGGVDSSVVASLAKEAAGRSRVLALMMPIHSHPRDLEDAKLVAKKLGIKAKIIDLSRIYGDFLKVLPPAGKLARSNLKPRLRMATLYYFANKLNYLVCGTGNKSEIAVGYFTKHGDGATDILPLGDLYKKEVRKLAKELKIPTHIITKPPTAGLWPGQTDEGEMGVTYNELDDILERMEKGRRQIYSRLKVKKVKKMMQCSEHKRQGPKVCYL
ncbi:MAG: NAD+ synthase [Candidatus Omnitrophica bacterium]|nr:NAD+ synthase [Candidatus Omnitrophota bacterium]